MKMILHNNYCVLLEALKILSIYSLKSTVSFNNVLALNTALLQPYFLFIINGSLGVTTISSMKTFKISSINRLSLLSSMSIWLLKTCHIKINLIVISDPTVRQSFVFFLCRLKVMLKIRTPSCPCFIVSTLVVLDT